MYVPSMRDVYYAAYITSKGWKYNDWNDTWEKEGKFRKVSNIIGKDEVLTEFDLDDASIQLIYEHAHKLNMSVDQLLEKLLKDFIERNKNEINE